MACYSKFIFTEVELDTCKTNGIEMYSNSRQAEYPRSKLTSVHLERSRFNISCFSSIILKREREGERNSITCGEKAIVVVITIVTR